MCRCRAQSLLQQDPGRVRRQHGTEPEHDRKYTNIKISFINLIQRKCYCSTCCASEHSTRVGHATSPIPRGALACACALSQKKTRKKTHLISGEFIPGSCQQIRKKNSFISPIFFLQTTAVDARAFQGGRSAPLQADLVLISDLLRPLRVDDLRAVQAGAAVRR